MSDTIFEADLDVAMQLAHNVAPPTKIVELSVADAASYVLASDVIAKSDLPPFNASRVDGYAVNGSGPWHIVGTNLAGHQSELSLQTDQAMYVATGAALPTNTETVVKQEDCQVDADLVQLNTKAVLVAGQNIRPAGIEATSGEIVIKQGTKLTPALVGLSSACGYEKVSVYQKPLVDVLVFGDELVHSGISGNGKVRDSIGPQLLSWIDYFGGQLNQIEYVADNLADHISAITKSQAHLVITTGGTASGPADFLHQAIIQTDGAILIDAVLVRPGYHQLIAELPNKFLIGLPGNPQSAVIGLFTLAAGFIAGSTNTSPPRIFNRQISCDLSAPNTEHRFVLAREISAIQNVGAVEPVNWNDSSMLRGFVDADGFAIIEPGGVKAGATVKWLPLPR